jgi:PEP-CTERM motif
MLRRSIAVLLFALACAVVSFSLAPPKFLEAVSLSDLMAPGATPLVAGDKSFSNFSFGQFPEGGAAGLTLPGASTIDVTAAVGPGGLITLSFAGTGGNLGLSATDDAFGVLSFGFNVTVTSSDRISAVSLEAVGSEQGASALAAADAVFFDPAAGTGATIATAFTDFPNVPVTATIPSLLGSTLGVDAAATVSAGPGDLATVDEVVFSFTQEERPSNNVPEPGSLTLMLGGLGIVLARRLYRRRG